MMRRTLLTLTFASAASLGVLVDGHAARACGGCFQPPTEVTVVNEHRMVFSISKTQTVLWDQIKYSGDPKEFAWVLPVRPGAKLELSHDEFMTALDDFTQPVITGPTPPPTKGSAFSCGSTTGLTASAAFDNGGGVTVVSEQVVGPYEVATLRATDAKALETWLSTHSYIIPPNVQPIVDAYVKEQFDFIALRLLPNKGVGAMRPVRVVTQGADATLPLRMVAAGVGQRVGILLYVIGEGRYRTTNFRDVTIDDSQLVWDTATQTSNYSTLADNVMIGGDGKGVLTEFAGHANKRDFGPGRSGFFGSTLADVYAQVVTNTLAQSGKCFGVSPFDASVEFADVNAPDVNLPDSNVVDGSSNDADVDGSSPADASLADANAPDAALPPAPNTDCVFDDVAVATRGMNPNDVWVTRMRMHLPVAALADDLQLGAESTQSLVSNQHNATNTTDSSAGGGCSESGGSNTWTGVALGALGAILVARRRKRGA